MDPVTIGVVGGSMLASGISQYMNSEQARKANKAELAKLKAIYGKIQTPQFDESGTSAPQFDMSKLTPEDYKLLGKYIPDVAAKVQEIAPTTLKETADSAAGRDAQMQALRRLKDVGSQDRDPAMQAGLLQAARSSQAEAESRNQSILADEGRKGMLGSGAALAAQLQGSSASMDRNAQMGQQASIEAYRNRLSALKDSATLGGQIRSGDMDMQSRNADIINSFNTRAARSAQEYQNMVADQANMAQKFNLDREQGEADKNTSLHNQYGVLNRQRDDEIAARQAQWQQAQKEYLNSLKQQDYGDQMQKAGAATGLSQMGMAQTTGAAQDKNAAINGIGQAGMGWGMSAYNNDRADSRAEKYGTQPQQKTTAQENGYYTNADDDEEYA